MSIKAVHFLLCFACISALSEAKSIISQPQPQTFNTFEINNSTRNQGSCVYTVTISTSCSSISATRDQISLAFGDAYGNQVYAPRLDDPWGSTFDRCSADSFRVKGPCTHQICYVYLYRTGRDGWKPDTVKIFGYYSKPVTFYFRSFLPGGVWYGFNYCSTYGDDSSSSSSSSSSSASK